MIAHRSKILPKPPRDPEDAQADERKIKNVCGKYVAEYL
jgi:hypothetical protein